MALSEMGVDGGKIGSSAQMIFVFLAFPIVFLGMQAID